MLQGAPQFTPRQLLEAGRRSEAEGKPDFAVQFYLHIAETYGDTPEAAEARTAIARMATAGGGDKEVWQDTPSATTSAAVVASPSIVVRDRYRSGRLLAAMLSGLGWIAVNLALLGLAVYAGARVFRIAILQPFDLGTDLLVRLPILLVAGATVVVVGQAMRALFDIANQSRRAAAERALRERDTG